MIAKTTERLKVRAYTSTHIFTGYVRRLPQQRLMDIVNGILAGTMQTNEAFCLSPKLPSIH